MEGHRTIGARRNCFGGWRTRLAVLVVFFASASFASAQEVQVQVDRGPHYLGDGIALQVVASGFEDDPTPEIETPTIDGAMLRFGGVSDSSSTSITYINGRLTRTKEVRFVYRYELTANRVGPVDVPSFRVKQGQTILETRPLRLQMNGVPSTGLVSLDVELPESPIFVGQKVPVAIVLEIDREAQRDLISIDSVVPLFDAPNLRFLDEPGGADHDSQLEIATGAGSLVLPAKASEKTVNGRRVLVLRAERTMIALSPEEVVASAPRVVISRGTRFRRDLFNQRQPTSMERLMSEGDPIRLEVAEVPREGRPPSFAGAVGSGFSLEVSADRSVVQLGEPIALTLTLRGDGDLSTAGLPRFDAEGFFDPARFRLPEEPPAGLVDETGKRFEANVRVLDAGVREIPALAYSWFDAGSRRFETVYSRPIALSVGAAQVIGADDVARRVDPNGGADEAQASAATPAGAADESRPGDRGGSTLVSGANLAIEADPELVLGEVHRATIPPFIVPVAYAAGLAALGFAVFDHRQRSRDPRDLARASALADAERGLEAARSAQGGEAASILGRALRELVAALPEEAGSEIDGLIAECDAQRFAPGGSGVADAAEGQASLLARAERHLASRREGEA